MIRPNALAVSGRLRLRAEVLEGVASIRALTDSLQALAVRSNAPVTACLPWTLASAEAAITAGTAERSWAILLRDDEGDSVAAAAVLLESWTPAGPAVRLAGAEGGYRTAMLSRDTQSAGTLAEALLGRLRDRGEPFGLALGPVDTLDPVVERMSMAVPDWALDGSSEIPVVRRTGPSEATEYLSPSVRRTLRKARNRLRADGVEATIAFTRERHHILALLPEMARAYRDRDRAHGVPSYLPDSLSNDEVPGWPLLAARIRGLAGRHGMEVGTLHLDGRLAAYVIGFDDGHAYRVMDGRFVSSWARYAPGRLLETAVLQRVLDDHSKSTVDWMTSIAPESLLITNHVERVVTMRARIEP